MFPSCLAAGLSGRQRCRDCHYCWSQGLCLPACSQALGLFHRASSALQPSTCYQGTASLHWSHAHKCPSRVLGKDEPALVSTQKTPCRRGAFCPIGNTISNMNKKALKKRRKIIKNAGSPSWRLESHVAEKRPAAMPILELATVISQF